MKRKNLIKFLPLTGVALLAPTLSLVSCNKDPEPEPITSFVYIDHPANKTRNNSIDPFWIGLNITYEGNLTDYVEWSSIFRDKSDTETWDFSLILGEGGRMGPSPWPEFHFILKNNYSSKTIEHSVCYFQINFKFYKNRIASQQLTWEETSQMIKWTWEDANE